MGCEEVREIEGGPKEMPNDNISRKNLIIKRLKGTIEKETELGRFTDCIIHNEDELENKVRVFVPTWIKDENNNDVRNMKDDIATKTFIPDFSSQLVIVVNGCEITRVEEENGNYVLFHDGKSYSSTNYCAVCVEKLPGNPIFIFLHQKPEPID